MICIAIGLGALGFWAMRRARRCGHHGYGWYGPWAPPHHRHHHRHHRNHGGRRWMLHAALSRLDATPAQERVIVHELDRLEERVRTARGQLGDTRGDLAAAIRGPVLDDAALGAVLGRVDATAGELRAAALEVVRNVHAVLDDQQRAGLAELFDRGAWRGAWGGGLRGGGGWGGGGPYR